MKLESTILYNLILNNDYSRQVIPYIKGEYFSEKEEKIVFALIEHYTKRFNKPPSKEALLIDLQKVSGLGDEVFEKSEKLISDAKIDILTDQTWLVETTEKFCVQKSTYNAILKAIKIYDSEDSEETIESIPKLLADAIGVSFDQHIGHDFLENYLERYDYYHKVDERIRFDLEYLNKITNGGMARKTLSIIMAGTGVGKSLMMAHMAAYNLMCGYNVLYITLELSEEELSKRIESNLTGIPLTELKDLSKDDYVKKVQKLASKTHGKLIIKEYPPTTAGSANFRHLLHELKLKKKFVPDIIYIDYLNLCCSSRLKRGQSNSYEYIKSIAEELRGLAVEFNVPVVSATQVNRTGYTNSDMGLEDTSESFGLPATADFFLGLIQTEELEALGQILVKQLKNRLGDPNLHKRFVIGVDKSRMRLFDVENSEQKKIAPEVNELSSNKPDKSKFSGFQ